MENESIKDKKQRANLLSINDEIKSSRTGRILKCYSKLSIYNKEKIFAISHNVYVTSVALKIE